MLPTRRGLNLQPLGLQSEGAFNRATDAGIRDISFASKILQYCEILSENDKGPDQNLLVWVGVLLPAQHCLGISTGQLILTYFCQA